MKKGIISFIGVLVLLFSLTGCVKFNAVMEIKEDKSMDFQIIYGINKSILEMSDEQTDILDEEQKQKMIDQGFTVKDYDDGTSKGFELIKHISNIDDYSSDQDVSYSISGIFEENKDAKMFKVEKAPNKNTYTASFEFDSSDSTLSDDEEIELNDDEEFEVDNNDEFEFDYEDDGTVTDDETNIDGDLGDLSNMTEAMASMDLRFVVKLPYAAISSNATEKSDDGRELTWKLDTENTENIEFKFELNNSKSSNSSSVENLFSNLDTSMIIAIISLVVGITSLIIVLVVVSKKKKNTNIN